LRKRVSPNFYANIYNRTLKIIFVRMAQFGDKQHKKTPKRKKNKMNTNIDAVAVAQATQPYVVETRRAFHQIPETRYETTKTREMILFQVLALGFLNDLEIGETNPQCPGGIIVDLNFEGATDRLLFRADFDALSVKEATSLPFASKTEGKMHACGHDAHTAMLLGFFKCVADGKAVPKHNLRLVFQDAEENPGTAPEPISGGDLLVRDGVCDGISAAYALHIWNTPCKLGTFYSRPGGMMGNSGRFAIVAENSNSHPVPIRQIFGRMNTFRARRIDPTEPVTLEPVILKMRNAAFIPQLSKQAVKVTIKAKGGHIMSPHLPNVNALRAAEDIIGIFYPLCGAEGMAVRAGTGSNILPAKAEIWFFATEMEDQMEHNLKVCQEVGRNFGVESVQVELTTELPNDIAPGTFEIWYGFRTMLHRDRHMALMDAMEQEIRSACGPGVKVLDVKKIGGHPALINNDGTYIKSKALLEEAGQPTEVTASILGGEDFAHYLYKVPGAMWFLGAHTSDSGGDHHAPTFNPDESVLWKGVLFWIKLATN